MKINVKFSGGSSSFKPGFQNQSKQIDTEFDNIQVVPEYINDLYEGDYTITPKVEAQTMFTKDKVMTDDVTIKEIPIYRTSNTSGGNTVFIGKEV